MAEIFYTAGDLFHAPKGAVLVHACNCQGVWGSGIAAQFAERFPDAYVKYAEFCKKDNPHPGSIKLIQDDGYTIACLLTSQHYGSFIDSPKLILEATGRCVNKLRIFIDKTRFVASPKINSGLFNVPWEDTEKVIKKNWHGDWHVYTPIR